MATIKQNATGKLMKAGQPNRNYEAMQVPQVTHPCGQLLFSFGLLQVRQENKGQALGSFAAAARISPWNPRYASVYAIALDKADKTAEAVKVLERSLEFNPYYRASTAAPISFCERLGVAPRRENTHAS